MQYLKQLPWLIVVLAIGWVAWTQHQEARATRALLAAKNEQLQQANLELGKAKTTLVKERDLHKSAMADLDKKWRKEIEAHQATITKYATLEAKYNAIKSGHTFTVVDLPKGQMYLRTEEGKYHKVETMQWSYKDFRITIEGDAIKQTISYKLHQKFRAQMVQTKGPTGAVNSYVKVFELDQDGKTVGEAELTKFEVLQAKDGPARMMWWNPKIDLVLGGGITTRLKGFWTGDIGLSLSAYGKTSNDLSWRFFRFGTGVTQDGIALSFSPAQWNLATKLPLFSNLWITPTLSYNLATATPQIGLGIGVMF